MKQNDIKASLLNVEQSPNLKKLHSSFVEVSNQPDLVANTSTIQNNSGFQNLKNQKNKLNKKIQKKFENQIQKQLNSIE